MIELSRRAGGEYARGFGGDTLNTAVYLARLGVAVDYLTGLGDDPFSTAMISAWHAEGVGVDKVVRVPGRVPGLYLIETDAAGERSFYYWRDSAPARDLFCRPEADAIRVAIEGCDLIYFSGISLSLYGDDGRAALFRSLTALRRRGGRVAFDSNYRPRNWPDIAEARAAFHAALGHADMALCGADDFRALFGYGTASRVIDGCRAAGVREIVVKDGSAPATVSIDDRTDIVPVAQPRQPVDTTAAGDSFNAAYLAARLAGAGAVAAARDGHLLAGAVIMHPGAIMPRAAMPAALMGATASKRKEPS